MEEIRSELGNITEALTDLHEKIEDENDNSGKFIPPPRLRYCWASITDSVAVLSGVERPSPINYNIARNVRKHILGHLS